MKDDGKVIIEVLVDYKEARQLRGFMDNVHLFSENMANIETNISERGKNSATKYFLIPKTLRNSLKAKNEVKCQRIETKNRFIFFYVVDKY